MKSRSGFTVVELVIVIIVISVLTTLGVVTYRNIQAQSRDAKRKADIETLVSLFEKYHEKNGVYPTGCSREVAINKANCVPGDTTAAVISNNPDAFYADTSLSAVRAIFPELSKEFGDPKRTGDPPFKGYPVASNTPNYFFFGQHSGGTTWSRTSIFGGSNPTFEINCNATNIGAEAGLGAGSLTTFALGYWGEDDQKWHIYQGRHGIELKIVSNGQPVRGTTVGSCVFEQ